MVDAILARPRGAGESFHITLIERARLWGAFALRLVSDISFLTGARWAGSAAGDQCDRLGIAAHDRAYAIVVRLSLDWGERAND